MMCTTTVRRGFSKHKKRCSSPLKQNQPLEMYTSAFALNPVWNSWVTSQHLPCQGRIRLNREHVIPRSLIHSKNITEATHNIIGFPVHLNSKRSNIRYTDSKKPGMPIWPCKTCREPHCPLMGKLNKDGFTPPAIYKPIIGASVMRSLYNHPEIVDIVHAEVLDLGLALEWTNNGYEDLPPAIKEIFRA